MSEQAIYLYAIGRGIDGAALTPVVGLQGDPVDVVEHRGLQAVVSAVPLDEFGEVPLKQNLESLEWLEKVARGHDEVVKAVAAVGPTAPLRLATICLDADGVRRRLDEWHDDLEQVLDRVDGRAEWSVKVVVPPLPKPASDEPATGGAAYLRQKKADSEARQQHQAAASSIGDRVHHELARVSHAGRLLPPQDPRLTGESGTMVLNGAYLVDLGEGDAFAALVHELAAEHPAFRISCGGPWPPYSFAVLESS